MILPLNGLHNGKRYTWGHEVTYNSYGCRGSEPVVPKPEGIYRLLTLGDSFTWGAGVSVEERYTEVTEKLIQQQTPSFDIVNLGYSGKSLPDYREFLFKDGDIFDPDRICIGFCMNDIQPKRQNYSIEREMFYKANRFSFKLIRNIFFFAPLLAGKTKEAFLNIAENSGAFPSWHQAIDHLYNKETDEWKRLLNALNDIKDWSDARALDDPVLLLLMQGTSTVEPTYFSKPDPLLKKMNRWFDQVEKAAEKIGFQAIDTRQGFLDKLDGKVLGVNVMDGHPSEKEHKIYAEMLAAGISDVLLQYE